MHSKVVLVSVIAVVVLAAFSGGAHAAQCACATAEVHVRSGAGTSHSVLGTLHTGSCFPHDGQRQVSGSYTWLHIDYNGQSGWSASNWLDVRTCPTSDVQLPGCPRIVTRAEWGARPPKHHMSDMPHLPIYVFIHHGASSSCHDRASCEAKVRGYQNYHMDGHGWSDIGYNFVVGEDGNAYEARGWTEVGAHTLNYNSVGIAICIIGNFMDHTPNAAALNTVKQLIQCGLDNHKINPGYTLKGHRDVGSTACPGDSLYQLIQSWSHYVPGSGLYNPTIG